MFKPKACSPAQNKLFLRREKVRKLRLECLSAREIAIQLKEPMSKIRRDLKYFDRQYRESSPHAGPCTVAEELDRLRHLESEAWKAWRRSQKPATVHADTREEGNDRSKSKVQKTKRSQVGDRGFLELIARNVMRRFQLLHMKQMEDSHGQDTILTFEAISQERAAITEFMERCGACDGIQDVYASIICRDRQPRALEISPAFGGFGSSADEPDFGTPIEADRADAASTWEI